MKKDHEAVPCPFLGEILMEYCQAYPVRKPIPKHQGNAESPCTGQGHTHCPFFNEIMARLHSASARRPERVRRSRRKEVT